MADVKIKIDIDADTAAIERVRAQLKALCREVDDCTDTHQKHTRTLRDLSREQKRGGDEDDKRSRKFSALGKMGKMLTKILRTLGKFGFLYMAIEAAAAVLVIGSAALAFKTGAFLAKAYQQALAGVAYGFAAVTAAAAAALAAQRQFQSVQMAPQYFEGGANTDDRFKGSSGAMKMLVDDISLAVIGAQGLQSAFTTLSKQGPVTGQTIGVLRELSNYTTGIGGDIAKNTESLAQFLAEFQKKGRMTQSVKELGAELGPDFTKILEDVTKMGISTFDQFASAAASGQLGETFANKYKGQLNAINSTVIGQFKIGLATIKAELMEIGEPMLGPLSVAIQRITRSFEALLIRIRGNVVEIGSGSLLDGLVNAIEKVNIMIGRLVSRDISRAGDALDYLKRGWEAVSNFFERIQDYLRPLQATATLLGEVLGRVLKLVGESFNNSVQALNDSLGDTSRRFDNFGDALVGFVESFLELVNFIRTQFIRVLPALVNFMTAISGLVALLRPGLEGLIGVLKTLVNLLSIAIRLFTLVLTPLIKVISVIDAIFNPLLRLVNGITGGLIDLNNIGQTLIATFIALKVAAYAAAASMAMGGKGGMIKNFLAQFAGKGSIRAAGKTLATGGKSLITKGGTALKAAAPAAKTAGAFAAPAVAGFGVGSLTGDLLFNADTGASRLGGAATGAATGAAVGAAIGSVIPVVGTAVGAAIGGFAGAIGGFMSAGKQRREANKAAKGILKSYDSAVADAIKDGDVDALKEAASKANLELQQLANSGNNGSKAVQKYKEELEKLNKGVENYVNNAENFEFFSGMDADKMNEFMTKMYGSVEAAQEAAMAGVINIFDVMRAGGIDVAAQWDAMMGDFNQSLVQQRLSMFDNQLQAIETQKAVNAAQRKVLEGDTSTEAVTDFLKKAYEFALSETGGDALAATEFMRKHLDNAYGPGGSLESVAGLIEEGANKLKLFDAETLINQIIQTGQLQAQGRAIESIAGAAGMNIDSGTAELQLRALLGTSADPAGTMNMINRLIEGGVTGKLTAEELVTSLFGGEAGLKGGTGILEAQANAAIAGNAPGAWDALVNAAIGGGSPGSATIPPMNMRSVTVGNVTVQVSGFIKDDKVADTIARQLVEKMNQYQQRQSGSGSGTSTPPPTPTNRR